MLEYIEALAIYEPIFEEAKPSAAQSDEEYAADNFSYILSDAAGIQKNSSAKRPKEYIEKELAMYTQLVGLERYDALDDPFALDMMVVHLLATMLDVAVDSFQVAVPHTLVARGDSLAQKLGKSLAPEDFLGTDMVFEEMLANRWVLATHNAASDMHP